MAQTEDRHPLTEGAEETLRFLRETGQSISSFCRDNQLDRIQVQRALNGHRKRFYVDFAWSMERATGGRAKVEMWREATPKSAAA